MSVSYIQKRKHAGKRFFEDLGNGQQLEMVLIPGGRFTMGSPDDEEGREDNEGPQHDVTVPTFFMGRYPVTQAQWRQVSRFKPVNPDIQFPRNPSKFSGKKNSDQRPVEQVTWHQAKEFCDRLSVHTNQNYRLPSEAEWEYACRAGTTTPFSFGETIGTEVANYDGNYIYGAGQKGEHRGETTPVDFFTRTNPWGLGNMHGNVWEWCLDHWHETYVGAPTDGRAWLEPESNDDHILRGGSCYSNPMLCRSAYRNHYGLDLRSRNIGLRVALAPGS